MRKSSRRCSRDGVGSVSVEMVLLTPVLVLLMLFVVFLGRAGGATEHIRHAADEAARAASIVARPNMQSVAQSVAAADLAANGFNCASTVVGLGVIETVAASSVTVTVSCVVNQQGTALLATPSRTLTASSTEVIDRYRGG